MSRRTFTIALFLVATMLIAAAADSACAQGGGRRGRGGRFGGRGFGRLTHQIQVAQLSEVETELKLTDEHKTQLADLEDEFDDARRDLGGGRGGGGGFRELSDEERAERDKLNADYAAKVNALLDESQQKRLQEVYVQVNGTALLTDAAMATLLNLTDEQKEKLRTVQDEQRQATMDAFQDLQGASREEIRAEMDELAKARDAALLAVLTDEQKQQFEGMKGEKLEIDMTQLQGRGFGGGGRGGRGRGGNRPGADDGA